ncbi:MAG TPA: tetratricopeptide repeat protein [Bryobacteraceae bacterium]|nr:tetratricopeptide repeat protein [Bryobacteraceae bacterium]
MTVPRLGALLFLAASVIPAQTLQQAEAYWKARNFGECNNTFRELVAQNPKNAEYRVQWGRMFLDHGTNDDIQNASDLFHEALGIKKDDADAEVGLAIIAADEFSPNAEELAHQALEWNPKELEAQELLARIALEDNNNEKAAAEAKKALAIDAGSPVAKGVLAAVDYLSGKKESSWEPHDARGYATIAHFFVMNRRYEEGIEYFHKAVALDPSLYSAHAELGLNLMRLSQNEEAYKELSLAFTNGFQNNATTNSLKLIDSYKNFVTTKTPKYGAILKLGKKEADLLRPYFAAEIDKCIETYEAKYKIELTKPVTVEVYPDHADFEVRAIGMPGMGALGVTFTAKSFGGAIAMDSPSGRRPGDFHWAATLWHEMSHVFTLTMTDSHVPRWFTEGIAVHEENTPSPEWGDRITPDILMAIKNKQLLPISDLDRGFIHPRAPMQVVVSYYQAGKICDYITNKWGWDTILAMLKDYANDIDTPTVIRKELKMQPEEFDKQFFATVEAENKKAIDGFPEWTDDVKTIAAASQAKDYDTVIKLGLQARDLFPDYVEAGSVYEFLAKAYAAKNDKADAEDELQRYVKNGGRDPSTMKTLADDLTADGKKKEAAAVLDRVNYIYPMNREQHQQLGQLLLDLNDNAGAIREFKAVIARDPIDLAQAHFNLARAYNQNRQPEQAKDELISSLEAAPGFRPAQKLLLELSGPDK